MDDSNCVFPDSGVGRGNIYCLWVSLNWCFPIFQLYSERESTTCSSTALEPVPQLYWGKFQTLTGKIPFFRDISCSLIPQTICSLAGIPPQGTRTQESSLPGKNKYPTNFQWVFIRLELSNLAAFTWEPLRMHLGDWEEAFGIGIICPPLRSVEKMEHRGGSPCRTSQWEVREKLFRIGFLNNLILD